MLWADDRQSEVDSVSEILKSNLRLDVTYHVMKFYKPHKHKAGFKFEEY